MSLLPWYQAKLGRGGCPTYDELTGKAALQTQSADHRFCGPRLFDLVMERSNSYARIGRRSHALDDQTIRRSPDPATDGLTEHAARPLTDSSALMPAYSLCLDPRQSSGRLTKPTLTGLGKWHGVRLGLPLNSRASAPVRK